MDSFKNRSADPNDLMTDWVLSNSDLEHHNSSTSRPIFGSPKVWVDSQISMASEGNWCVFYDNSGYANATDSLRRRTRGPKALYRHKPYEQEEPPPPLDPLTVPIKDNYKAFRARRRIYASHGTQSKRSSEVEDDGLVSAVSTWGRTFHGDDPSRYPFRRSTQLYNEQRLEAAKPQPRVSMPVVRQSRPSLFKRSIKAKKKVQV
jgi:hypothetical protein